MKHYRLGYDFLFLPQKSFKYKNDYIGAMGINVLFKVINDDGSEKFFDSADGGLRDQAIAFHNGENYYLSELIKCSFDREKIITFNPNISLLRRINFSFSWEIESYCKDIDKGILEPEIITETEFMDIMKNNKDTFDNSDNYSAQTTSYFTQEVDTTSLKL